MIKSEPCPCVYAGRPVCCPDCWHYGGMTQCACGQPPKRKKKEVRRGR